MSEVIFPKSTVVLAAGGEATTRGKDPFAPPTLPRPSNRPSPIWSSLILTSVLAPIVGGPFGSIAAIVFGWSARREVIGSAQPRHHRLLSTVGISLGLCLTVFWGAAIAFEVMSAARRSDLASTETLRLANGEIRVAVPIDKPQADAPRPHIVQKQTIMREEGSVQVIDIGASVSSLAGELAKLRADASRAGDVVLVMTTREVCDACVRFSKALVDPRIQAALSHVRLVRIDVDVFDEDLSGLKIPVDRVPGFFLLGLELFPSDAIDSDEWDDDAAANIAPVLGAFLRGKYESRRRAWQTVHGSGIPL